MAKSKTVTTSKPTVAKQSTLKENTGALYKNSDGNFEGAFNPSEAGEYWLNGYIKKDDAGALFLFLDAGKKKETDAPADNSNVDRGVLYKNNRKKLKHQPDYTGTIGVTVAGEVAIKGAIMESRQGLAYMSLEVASEHDEEFDAESFAF